MTQHKVIGNKNIAKRATVLLLVAIGLLLVSCGGDFLSTDKAMVDRVETQSRAGNPPRYFAIAYGHFEDNCTEIGRTQQRVVHKTIMVTMYTRQTDGAACTYILVPFRESVRLDVSGLSAGQYAVDVNGAVTTLNLAENH